MDFKKLLIRSVSGLAYIAIIVFCILYNRISFLALTSFLSIIATFEFLKINSEISNKNILENTITLLASLCLSLSCLIYPLVCWIFIILARMIIQLYKKDSNPIKELGIFFISQMLIALPLGLMGFIGDLWSQHILLAIFIFIWINDTGAYIVGCSIGRHRLFERISPKKSWEGFFGGFIFTIIASIVFCLTCAKFFSLQPNIYLWISLGALTSIFGTWGDLAESMVKRTLNIKDSGNIIPGHGGILDRIDSLLFVLPIIFIFLMANELFLFTNFM